MKNIYFILIFPLILSSQVNFSEDISPIIYNKCTECHFVGGAGPMPFTSYEEVASLGVMINYVTQSGYMPPWHADPDYSNFLGERVLTDDEKQLISDWVDGGMEQGDPLLEAEIPEFVEGSVIGVPDAVLTMEEEYLIEGNNQDDYRVFVFSTNFPEDKYLKSIEIIPGNLSAVHHVLVNIDTSGACADLDASTPEYGYECESGFCIGSIPQLSAGYTPGMVPPIWNNDIGLVLPAGADIAIQIHYAPSSIDEYDQSSVNLFFKDQPVEREVEVLTIVDTQLQIPANEIYTHYNSYQIPFDMSLISVLPHMHLIGKSWLIYAENNGDTIPIISIPDWDFNWQTFYQPEYMLKLPEGYTLHAYATYDNTSSNPTNPNSPPQEMFWCDYTTCEMFFLPFAYVPYQEGDENIYLGNIEDEVLGCTDSEACNYDISATDDNGSCQYPEEYYNCNGNCLNDINNNGICDEEEQEDCSNLEIESIYQSNSTQFTIHVYNSSLDNMFAYPGFILFNSFGDTLAIENVNFFGIFEESVHVLEIQENVIITSDVSLQLYTGFSDFFQCEWFELNIIDNCDLQPDSGECDGAFQGFYFDANTLTCEEMLWGGCGGVVPFWTLEDCQDACLTVDLNETIYKRQLIKQFDILGRDVKNNHGLVIKLYDDGSIEQSFNLTK